MIRAATRLASPALAAATRPSLAAASSAASSSFVARPAMAVPAVSVFRRTMAVHNAQSDDDLREVLEKSGDKLVIVDWSAAWCGPCKQIAPVYSALSEEHKNVVFIKADIDTLQDASVEAGVQSVPTFHFIKNNELVAEFSGADQNKLKALIKQHA